MEETSAKKKPFLPKKGKFSFKNGRKSKTKVVIRLSKIKYQDKVLESQRVVKVTKGRKANTYRTVVVVGDQKEKVGIGIGRSPQSTLSREKAVVHGKKNLMVVPLTKSFSIPCMVFSSYGACRLLLKPASLGTGIIASGVVRTVLELAGIKNVVAKQFGAKNIFNNAKATMLALALLKEKVFLGKSQSFRRFKLYQRKMKHSRNAELSL